MPTVAPSPDAIVVDDFSSSLYPVASFILCRNSTNTPPTHDPQPPAHANHDESAAVRPASSPIPSQQLRAPTTHTSESTWADIARTNHPNPQHVPYAEGRGPSSKRRYRKRTTRRRLLTTNTLSILLPLSISSPLTDIRNTPNAHEQRISTLRKIHKKHSSILLPTKPDHTTKIENSSKNINAQIDSTITEIESLSIRFNINNTAERIEQEWNTESELDIATSLFYQELILPTEATLQLALDDFNTYVTNLNETKWHITTTKEYPHTAEDDDEYSTISDIEPNTTELEAIYKDTNTSLFSIPTATPQNATTPTQPNLIDLLLRYDTTTPIQQIAQQRIAMPILPPWGQNHENLPHPTTSNHNTPHWRELPILPPIMEQPPRPHGTPPSAWTFERTTTVEYQQNPPQDTEEYIDFEHNTQLRDQYYDINNNNNNHNSITNNAHHKPTQTNNRRDKQARRHTTKNNQLELNTITRKRKDKNFTNKLVCITQNMRGLPINDDTKLQSLIHQMKERNYAAICLQETWRLGEDEFYIDNYRVILKGNSKKTNEMGHVMGGVCIILSPEMDEAHKLALNKRITLPAKHKHEGRFLGLHLHFKKRDSHGKNIKGRLIKITLCSLYHPVDSAEHEEFNGITQTILNSLPRETKFILGQDVNCNVGIATNSDPFRGTLGPNGIDNRNKKGTKFLQHMCTLDMVIANTFFTKSNYTTWKNFKPSNPSHHMLDIFSVSKSIFNRITDCGTIPFGVDYTDHTATSITININSIALKSKKRNNTSTKARADWNQIAYNQEAKNEFNIRLSNEIQQNNTTDDYTSFFESVGNAAKATATKIEQQTNSWFEMSKTKLQPAIDHVTALQQSVRDPNNPNTAKTKQELQLAYRLRNIAVREAKSKYMSHIAQKISSLTGDNTRAMWEAINECKLGHENNYTRPKIMSLTKPDGSRTTNNKENITIMRAHCEQLFNNKKN